MASLARPPEPIDNLAVRRLRGVPIDASKCVQMRIDGYSDSPPMHPDRHLKRGSMMPKSAHRRECRSKSEYQRADGTWIGSFSAVHTRSGNASD